MTFDDNFKWEAEGASRGADNFWYQQDSLREKGQGDQTVTSQSVMRQRLLAVSVRVEALATKKGAGRAAPFNRGITLAATRFNNKDEQYTDYNVVAYIALSVILQELARPDLDSRPTITQITKKIGEQLHHDAKYYAFERIHPAYYAKVMASMKEQNVTSYRHIHRTLMKKSKDMELPWDDWSETFMVQVGAKVLHCMLQEMGDLLYVERRFRRNRQQLFLETTVEFDDWVADNERELGEAKPLFLPTKIKPRDWEWDGHQWSGGYYHPRLSRHLPFIKAYTEEHKEYINQNPPMQHASAINIMQNTAWEINKPLLDLLRKAMELGKFPADLPQSEPYEIPVCPLPADLDRSMMTEHQLEILEDWKAEKKWTLNRDLIRKSKMLLYGRACSLAEELSNDKFYFVYTCDFRGRIYCATPGLSVQGADPIKGLMHFSVSKPLGEDGLFWLAVNIANKYGYDKVSYEDRVLWVEEHEQEIKAVFEDPLGAGYSFAGDADKPFQFIAACREWALADYGRNPEATSRLPVGLDGSCNGLQHFSALLRDGRGAKATNLANTVVPSDIYAEVAEVAAERVLSQHNQEPSSESGAWLRAGIDRKCTKRPVMTLPYGATRQSCRKYLADYVMDNLSKFEVEPNEAWRLAKWMTPHVWAAIGDVVVAAREGMDWLQWAAKQQAKQGCVRWLTPKTFFPVYQNYMDTTRVDVRTQLLGNTRLSLRAATESVNSYKQALGISPNFTHSNDASHMVMTINQMDGHELAMIHDDYGTHACDTEKLFQQIRIQFVRFYWGDNLQWWINQQNLPITGRKPPEYGDFSLPEVLESEYFFG